MLEFLTSLFKQDTPRALVRAAKAGERAAVERLLDAGVPVDARAEGVFPLFGAAFYGHLEVVRLLRQRGARLDLMVDANTSTLHALAQLDASAEVCAALLDGATDVDLNTNGLTPLMLACAQARTQMVEALLAHGADVNATFPQSMVVEPFPGDVQGFTPLAFALQNGHDALVPVLLAAGARIDLTLAHGTTALMLAASAAGPQAIEALLDAGADPNGCPTRGLLAGATPLMVACTMPEGLRHASPVDQGLLLANRLNVARALIAGGADVRRTDQKGKTARAWAQEAGLLALEPGLFG